MNQQSTNETMTNSLPGTDLAGSPGEPRNSAPRSERGLRWLLSLSAVALLGLLTWRAQAMQLGRDGGGSQGMVSNAGDYTMMTFSIGNEDMLLTLDNRAEELYIYRVENQTSVAMFQKLNLPRLFNEARIRAVGGSK
ncbi:MAG: hypothetical protein U0638_08585 [Phycisphaerales bacterium]